MSREDRLGGTLLALVGVIVVVLAFEWFCPMSYNDQIRVRPLPGPVERP